jgi:hypothetical protein
MAEVDSGHMQDPSTQEPGVTPEWAALVQGPHHQPGLMSATQGMGSKVAGEKKGAMAGVLHLDTLPRIPTWVLVEAARESACDASTRR